MSRFRLETSAAALIVAVLGLANWSFGQQKEPVTRQDRQERPSQPQNWAGQPGPAAQAILDQMAAEGILQMNKGEIELANFALKHTQNEEVRKFAQSIVTDQTNLSKQLERFVSEQPPAPPNNPAGGSSTAQPTTPGTPPAQGGRETSGATAQAGTSGDSSWKAMSIDTIRRDVANQVVASIERELAQYQGSDFDRAYVGLQFWGQVVFVASAKAGAKHLSNDLRQVVEQGAQTGEMHLDECRKLIRDLTMNVARSTETTPRR